MFRVLGGWSCSGQSQSKGHIDGQSGYGNPAWALRLGGTRNAPTPTAPLPLFRLLNICLGPEGYQSL